MTSAPTNPSVTPSPAGPAVAPAVAHMGQGRAAGSNVSMLGITTLTLWLTCLAVGALGMALSYPRPVERSESLPPLTAELLNVQLTEDPAPARDNQPPPPQLNEPNVPPPLLAPPSVAQPPQLTAVAEPSPAIAFALPVEGPVKIVSAKNADFGRPAASTNTVAPGPSQPAVKQLTFGVGDGAQLAPNYPEPARRAGQEGVVVVRFTVGTDGKVFDAIASQPSPWPMLNSEAVRTVKRQWKFPPGSVRLYEVPIRFYLK